MIKILGGGSNVVVGVQALACTEANRCLRSALLSYQRVLQIRPITAYLLECR